MSGVSRIVTGGGPVSTLPLTSPVSVPLKKGDGEDFDRPLRPTLSFRQKPEPPKLPSQLAGEGSQQPLRPTLSFRQKPEPPVLRNGEQLERTLRTTLSFRGKPEPPRSVNFAEPPRASDDTDRERQKQMQKTKSKIDMLSNLIREGSSAGASPSHDSSSDEESDDEAVPINQGTGGRILIRPSAPPPPPPGLAQASSLPPLPPVNIKPSAPSAPAAASAAVPDDNARENWVTMWSPEQKCNYWFNKKTGVSTWEDPTALPQAPPTASPPGTMRGSGGPSRANELEKQIHKKTMDRGSHDDEVDVFGRSGAQRGSGGSNGSSNSSRQSLRATLSRALFGSSKKLPVAAKKDDSPRNSDSMPHEHRGPILNAPPPDPNQAGGVSPEDLRSTVRSQGSMVSFTSSTSHESEGSVKSHTPHDKHVEIVAEVVTKAGRHTIVRSKKSKKKDHSMPLSPVSATPPPTAAHPGMMQPVPMHPGGVQPTPMQPAVVQPIPMQPVGVQPMPMAINMAPGAVQPTPMQSGIAPPVAMQPPAMQHGMVQPMPMVQQQGLVRTASARNMPPASPYGGMHMPQPMQHFGMPHPQQMGGPAFLQPQPFAAYAQQTAAPGYAPYAPPSPQPMASRVQYVQALYDFMPNDPNNSSELSLRRGDVLQLIEQGADGWWEGIHSATGQRGLFPGSHVHLVS